MGPVGRVTYTFKIMLFVSTEIFDDMLRPQIVSVVPTANAPLRHKLVLLFYSDYHYVKLPPLFLFVGIRTVGCVALILYIKTR